MKKSNNLLLSVLLPLALVAATLLSMFFYQKEIVMLSERRTNLTLRESALEQAATFETALDGQYDVLRAFAGALAAQEEYDWENLRARMHGVVENTKFLHLFIVDANGLARSDDGREVYVSERRYFAEAMAGEEAFQRVESGLLDRAPRLILSVPVLRGGVPVGVLYGSFSEQLFRSLLIPGNSARGGYSFVCDSYGKIIIGSDSGGALMQTENFLDAVSALEFETSGVQELRENLTRQRSGVAEFRVDGQRQYAVYQPMGRYDWVIFNVLPGSVIDAESDEIALRGNLLMMVVLALSLLFLATIVCSLRRQARQLSELARRDMMTGLLNHFTALEDIKTYLEKNPNRRCALFMVDMDNFKMINDLLGHQAGDRLIKRTADDLCRLFGEQDVVGRVGGDEYAVLWALPEETGPTAKAEDICRTLHYAYQTPSGPVMVTCSVGVSLSARGKSADQLYHEADIALYRAKNSGKDRFCIIDDEIS